MFKIVSAKLSGAVQYLATSSRITRLRAKAFDLAPQFDHDDSVLKSMVANIYEARANRLEQNLEGGSTLQRLAIYWSDEQREIRLERSVGQLEAQLEETGDLTWGEDLALTAHSAKLSAIRSHRQRLSSLPRMNS